METKHTPGEWRYEKEDLGDSTMFSIKTNHNEIDDNDNTIAGIWNDSVINEANAKLIAAAPELLTSLQEMISIVNELDGEERQWVIKKVNDAKAVILKATA